MQRLTTFLAADTDFKATSCASGTHKFARWVEGRCRRGIFGRSIDNQKIQRKQLIAITLEFQSAMPWLVCKAEPEIAVQ